MVLSNQILPPISNLNCNDNYKLYKIQSYSEIVEGEYEFLFTSGPSSNYWQNKWVLNTSTAEYVTPNLIQTYYYTNNSGGPNNKINFISSPGLYFVSFRDNGYQNTNAIIMNLGNDLPPSIQTVNYNYGGVGNDLNISASLSHYNTNIYYFVRYTKNNWQTSNIVKMDVIFDKVIGAIASATIPGQDVVGGEGNQFYIFGSPVDVTNIEGLQDWEYDLYSVVYNNNNKQNFVLPVELVGFSVKVVNGYPLLSWKTISEINNWGFEIERRTKNSDWEKIGFVKGSGNSNRENYYEFIDRKVSYEEYSYRIKQIDFDGKFEYSNIQTVRIDLPEEIVLEQNYPNPFNPITNIRFASKIEGNASLKIFDMFGREIAALYEGRIIANKTYNFEFNGYNLSSGTYVYKLSINDKSLIRKMLLIK